MERLVHRALLPITCGVLAAGCIVKTVLPADDDTPADDDVTGDDDTVADDDDADCGYEAIEADPDGTLFGRVSLDADLQPRIDVGCDCHQVGNPGLEDLSPGRVWGEWVGQAAVFHPGEVLVVAGDPEASVVFWKVFDCYPLFPFLGERMPPNAPPLTIDDVSLFYNWILQGAEDN